MFMFSHSPKADRRAGFTVTEVVISAAVMVVVFMAVMGALSYGRRSGSLTENRLYCLHMARQTLEDLGNKSYDSSVLSVGTTHVVNSICSYVVTEESDGLTKNVTVTATWKEPTGMVQSISLVTSFSKSLHK